MQETSKQVAENFYKTVYGYNKHNSQDEIITASK